MAAYEAKLATECEKIAADIKAFVEKPSTYVYRGTSYPFPNQPPTNGSGVNKNYPFPPGPPA